MKNLKISSQNRNKKQRYFNPFCANGLFLYPLKTWPEVFWYFQEGIEKYHGIKMGQEMILLKLRKVDFRYLSIFLKRNIKN